MSNELAVNDLQDREYLPLDTFIRTLSDRTEVRIVKIIHPFRNQPVTILPYLDLAKAFSYDEESIRQMIFRTPWVKKHTITCVIQAVDGKFRAQLCLLYEGVLGIFLKLQPGRCKDPWVAEHINQRQEELILLLSDALNNKQTSLTVDRYKSSRLAADLIARITKTEDLALREILYQELEATLGRSVPRPARPSMPLFEKTGGAA